MKETLKSNTARGYEFQTTITLGKYPEIQASIDLELVDKNRFLRWALDNAKRLNELNLL